MNNGFYLIGRITKDLELRTTNSGKYVLDVPLAINNGKDDTTFITVTIFNAVAETTSKYCKKGDLVGTRGVIKNHNWEDSKGNKHYDYQFLADKISFLSTKRPNDKIEIPQNVKSDYDNEQSDIQLTDADLPF